MTDESQNTFTLDNNLVYLNHAAVAPWPKSTADAVANFARENATHGAQHYPRWMEVEHKLRAQLQQLLNAPSIDDIALLKNTSEGLSIVAHGLSWQAGDHIVGIDHEFPSNRIVWESLATQGVTYTPVDVNQADDPEQALMQACGPHTRLLAVSSVHYATGLRLNLHRLGAFCRERSILFCIDAIQSLGAFDLNVQEVEADFVCADGHKWLLGPEGIAVFYCRAALREQLALHQFGWHMLEHPGDYARVDWQPSKTATRFECGSPNMLGIHGLNASLSVLLETGIDRVSEQILNAVDYLVTRLKKIENLEIISQNIPNRNSGILNFEHKRITSESLYKELMRRNIVCAQRGAGVRFSPHYYTKYKDMEIACDTVREIVGTQ